MPEAYSSCTRGDSYCDSKTYRCHLSPQTSWLHPPHVTMGATKLCQNSHLIRTSEWKLRIYAISTLHQQPLHPSPPFPSAWLSCGSRDWTDSPISRSVPCSSALRLSQNSMQPLTAVPGLLWPLVQLLRNPEKETAAFLQCVSRNKAFREGYTALALPARCSRTQMKI